MHPEGGIARGGEEITARITTDVIVHASVGANLGGVGYTFGDVAEGINVGLREEGEDGGPIGVALVHSRADVSLETARVVTKTTERTSRHSLQTTDGSQVDGHVGEGASRDIAASEAGGKLDVAAADAGRRHDDGALMRDVLPVAAETVRVAVEEGGVLRGRRVLGPVPVGLRPVVAALLTEGLLVLVDVPPMPWLEVAAEVDVEGLLDMGHDKVIEPRPCSRRDTGRCERGKGLETLDSVDVGETLRGRERATGCLVSGPRNDLEW